MKNQENITGRRPESLGREALALVDLRLAATREVADVGVLGLAAGDRQHDHAQDHEARRCRGSGPGICQAYAGFRALKTSGWRTIQGKPLAAIQGNQISSMNQPNKPPTLLVPRHCALKRTKRLTSVAATAQVLAKGLVGAKHADRRGDHAVGREQARRRDDEVADHREADDLAGVPLEQAPEGEGAALAPVVGPHDQHVVLHRQEDKRPQDQAEPAEDLLRRDEVAALLQEGREHFLVVDVVLELDRLAGDLHDRVEDRRADVAIDGARGLPHPGEQATAAVSVALRRGRADSLRAHPRDDLQPGKSEKSLARPA